MREKALPAGLSIFVTQSFTELQKLRDRRTWINIYTALFSAFYLEVRQMFNHFAY